MSEVQLGSKRSGRRLLLAGGCLFLSLLSLLVGWWMNQSTSRFTPPTAAARSSPVPQPLAPGPQGLSPAPPPLPEPEGPSIATATIDKDEICAGEQNILRVHRHDEVKNAEVFVDGEPGTTKIFSLFSREEQVITPKVMLATSKGPVFVKAPSFKIKPCIAPLSARIEHVALGNAIDVYRFSVHVRVKPGTTFEPVLYRWNFGDGSELKSSGGSVEHDYGHRAQTSPSSELLVRVEISDKLGNKLEAFDKLNLKNEAFQVLQQGAVQIFSDLNPRFPEEDRHGDVRHTVKLWHVYDRPVRVAKVTVEESDDHKTRRRIVEAGEILSGTTLRPGQTIEFPVRLEKGSPYRVVRYQVHGKSDDGKIAGGGFSIQRPTARPTAEDHSPVDARTAMRIRMAQKILGKPFVSDGDMDRLEAQGAFRKLEARPD